MKKSQYQNKVFSVLGVAFVVIAVLLALFMTATTAQAFPLGNFQSLLVAKAEQYTKRLADQANPAMALTGCTAKTAFSPNGGGVALIIETINSAQKQIRLAAYSFTEPTITKALLDAHKRGVDVAIVLDTDHNGKRQGGPSAASTLASNGVPVRVTSAFAIQHNKFIVVDGSTVETGSFNYSRAAEKSNAENVLVISQCAGLANSYLPVWKNIWDTGVDFKGNY